MNRDEDVDYPAGRRLILRSLRRRGRTLALGATLAVAYTAFKVTGPILLRSVVNRGGSGIFLVAMLIAAAGQSVCGGARRYTAMRLAARIQTDLRQRLFEHWQRLSFGFHDRAQTGQLMARANSDVQQIEFFVVYIPLLIANLLTFLAAGVFMLAIDVVLAVFAMSALPALFLTARAVSRKLSPVVARLQQRLSDLTTVVEETVTGIRVVKAMGREDERREKLEAVADQVRDESLTAAHLKAVYLPLMVALPSAASILVLLYGGSQVVEGAIGLGDLIAFMFFIGMLIWPLQLVGELTSQWRRSAAAAARVHEVLAEEPAIEDLPGARDFPRGSGLIRFEGVYFSYSPRKLVLEDVDLEVPAGSSVAIVGPTGCGKSTVARLIPRFYDIDSGCISIDGVDIRNMTIRSLRDRIGIVFEDTFLFTDSIRENIAYGNLDATDAQIEEAARLAAADRFIEELPEGYDTVVGEQGLTLSGGQRQRIAIARALLRDPEILILDSATTSVDARVEQEIRDALETVMEGRTTVIVADRPATVSLADRVIFMDSGRVVAEGTHEELLESAQYAALMSQDLAKGA